MGANTKPKNRTKLMKPEISLNPIMYVCILHFETHQVSRALGFWLNILVEWKIPVKPTVSDSFATLKVLVRLKLVCIFLIHHNRLGNSRLRPHIFPKKQIKVTDTLILQLYLTPELSFLMMNTKHIPMRTKSFFF